MSGAFGSLISRRLFRTCSSELARLETAFGTGALVAKIKAFWVASGHVVESQIEPFATERNGGGHGVRSNLFNRVPK